MQERIQKIMANRGYCSRRRAEELIAEGKVRVNGKLVKIGDSADKNKCRITVKGIKLKKPVRLYFALNKPKGVECTLNSTSGKETVVSLVKTKERIIPAGRLDVDSRGLILLTNDGGFANRVMHPSYELDKVYKVKVKGEVPTEKIELMRRGMDIGKGDITSPCEIKLIKRSADTTMLTFKIHEGKNRQIRRMIEKIGFKVIDLLRIRVGNITLRGIAEGRYVEIKKKDLNNLKRKLKLIQ